MNSSVSAIGNVLLNTVSNGTTSPKCETQKNTTPFTLHSADNPQAADNTTEITANNIASGDTNTTPKVKHLTIIKDKDGKTTNHQKVDENINKQKSKTINLAVGIPPVVNQPLIKPNQKLSNANLLSGNKITIITNGSRQQQMQEKALTKTAQLTNDASKTAPKSVFPYIVDGSSLTNKATMQKGDYSHIKLPPSAGKVSYTQHKKDNNIKPMRLVEPNNPQYRNEKADNSQKIIANGKEEQTDKSKITGSTGKKTPLLDLSLSTVQKKPIEVGQKTPVITVKSTAVTEKPIVSEPSTKIGNNYAKDVKALEKSLIDHKKEPLDNRASNISIQKPNVSELQVNISQTKNLSMQKPNISEHQVSINQTKNLPNSTSDKSPNSDLERILSLNNEHSFVLEQPRTSSQIVNISNQQVHISPTSGTPSSINEQIIESFRASLHQVDLPRQVTVRLEPPDLGNVLVKFQEQEDRIIGLLEFSKPEIKYEMEQVLPQIIRTLEDCGIQIKKLEVQLADQFEPYTDRDLTGDSLENSLLQHQHSAEGGDSEGNSKEWLTNSPENSYPIYHNDSESPLIITNESINMLI